MKITSKQLNKIIRKNLNEDLAYDEVVAQDEEAEVTAHELDLVDAIEVAMNNLGETWVLNFLRSYTANY